MVLSCLPDRVRRNRRKKGGGKRGKELGEGRKGRENFLGCAIGGRIVNELFSKLSFQAPGDNCGKVEGLGVLSIFYHSMSSQTSMSSNVPIWVMVVTLEPMDQ